MREVWERYITETDADGHIKSVEGLLAMPNVRCEFKINEQTSKCNMYRYRGFITVISQKDGYILQKSNYDQMRIVEKKRLKGMKNIPSIGVRDEAFNIRSALYTNDCSEKNLKPLLLEKAQRLFSENYYAIRDDAGIKSAIGNLLPYDLLIQYKEEFANQLNAGSETKKTYMATLERVFILMGNDRLFNSIDNEFMHSVYKRAGKGAERMFKLSGRFIDFCKKRTPYITSNPFQLYLQSGVIAKKGKAIPNIKATILTCEQEKNINSIIVANYQKNALYLGLSLIKDAGITVNEVFSICWQDVLVSKDRSDFVCIKFYNANRLGATHNFTRPCFPYCAKLLSARYMQLLKRYDSDKLDGMPVIAKKRTEADELLKLSRAVFNEVHIDASGDGINMLMNTYRNKLDYICGLGGLDRYAFLYMLGNSLSYDVTADHYRSFSTEDGLLYLFHALQRDTRFDLKPFEPEIPDELSTRFPEIKTIKAHETNGFAAARVELDLYPGEIIQIHSEKGFTGYVMTSTDGDK